MDQLRSETEVDDLHRQVVDLLYRSADLYLALSHRIIKAESAHRLRVLAMDAYRRSQDTELRIR